MIEIPQAPAGDTWLRDQQPSWRHAELDGVPTVLLSCSRGHLGYLADHTIAADGTVAPSLQCSFDGCSWHVMGKLKGYQAP